MDAKPKEKGFYGWWLLPLLGLIYSIPIGFAYYCPPVLYPSMITTTGWSRGELMLGYTIIGLVMGLSAPITAWMINRLGARTTLTIGAIVTAAATFLLGLFGYIYPVYLILCLLAGIGIGFGSILPVQTVAIYWFNIHRALALGIVMGGGAVGGFFYPKILSVVVLNAAGNWQIGWLLIGGISLIGALIAILAVRNKPADLGQYPDGLSPDQLKVQAENNKKKVARTYRTSHNWTVAQAIKTPSLWLLIIANSFVYFLWQLIITQTPLHLHDRGFDAATAASFYSLAVGFSIIGRFSLAGLGEIIETRFLYAFAGLCTLIGGFLFWLASPSAMWAVYLYPLFAGFGFGMVYVCVPHITSNYWGINAFARVSGVTNPIASVIQFLAPSVAGFLYDSQGNYGTALLIACAGATVGIIAILLCRPPKPKLENTP